MDNGVSPFLETNSPSYFRIVTFVICKGRQVLSRDIKSEPGYDPFRNVLQLNSGNVITKLNISDPHKAGIFNPTVRIPVIIIIVIYASTAASNCSCLHRSQYPNAEVAGNCSASRRSSSCERAWLYTFWPVTPLQQDGDIKVHV